MVFDPIWTLPSAEPLSPTSFMQPLDAGTDGAGNLLLIARYSGPFAIAGEPLAIQAASGFGVVLAKYERDGTPLWHRSLPGHGGFSNVAADSMGNVVALGRSLGSVDLNDGLLDADGPQLLLAKYAPSGKPLLRAACATVDNYSETRGWELWKL